MAGPSCHVYQKIKWQTYNSDPQLSPAIWVAQVGSARDGNAGFRPHLRRGATAGQHALRAGPRDAAVHLDVVQQRLRARARILRSHAMQAVRLKMGKKPTQENPSPITLYTLRSPAPLSCFTQHGVAYRVSHKWDRANTGSVDAAVAHREDGLRLLCEPHAAAGHVDDAVVVLAVLFGGLDGGLQHRLVEVEDLRLRAGLQSQQPAQGAGPRSGMRSATRHRETAASGNSQSGPTACARQRLCMHACCSA